jgi:hypothetical protein
MPQWQTLLSIHKIISEDYYIIKDNEYNHSKDSGALAPLIQ